MSNFEILTLEQVLSKLASYNYKELHVHHTWRPNHEIYFENPDPLYWQEAMKRFHIETNGWSDIGQHVTLLPDGRFVTGRPFNQAPASIKGFNSGAFAVEMIGDFDIGKDVLQGPQRDSIIGLARWFNQRGKYIRFHRENASKSCPGTGIDKTLFMAEVEGKALTLKKGIKSEEVRQLQENLIKLGYNLDPCGADGSFGPKTETVVMAFQRDNGLEVDGKAGPKTQAKIQELLKALEEHKEDPRIKELQKQLTELQQKYDSLLKSNAALEKKIEDAKKALA